MKSTQKIILSKKEILPFMNREFKQIKDVTIVKKLNSSKKNSSNFLINSKQGKYVIEICDSPSCYVNGSINIIKYLIKKLGIKSGGTTKDGKFSLHICSCIGCCDKAPAMKINKKVYGNLTKEKIDEILRKCKQ